jgi:hypothetical protein
MSAYGNRVAAWRSWFPFTASSRRPLSLESFETRGSARTICADCWTEQYSKCLTLTQGVPQAPRGGTPTPGPGVGVL